MHTLEVVVPCQGILSGLLMTPGGSGLVGMEGAAERGQEHYPSRG